MAIVQLNPDIPVNIFEIPSTRSNEVRTHFERGDLVILSDVRIDADFDYLSKLEPPATERTRRDKYAFWRVRKRIPNDQSLLHQFGHALFSQRQEDFDRFVTAIRHVNAQMDNVVRTIFNRHTFLTKTVTWKFQRNRGENIHIDNLEGCNQHAQVRLFANLDSKSRKWAVGRHWQYYAERLYQSARLHEVANDPYKFNGRLTQTAFGPSWSSSDEPRHMIEFAPGEMWLVNSALVAHQIRHGNLLCTAHYEYPYRQYVDRSVSLPSRIKILSRKYNQPESIFRRYGSKLYNAILPHP